MSARFPVDPADFEKLVRLEGQLMRQSVTDSAAASNVIAHTPYGGIGGGSFTVPPGRAFYVSSIAMGGAQVYRHQAGVTPFEIWGLSGDDPITFEGQGTEFQGGGPITTMQPGMILFEFDRVQFSATNYTDFPGRAFNSFVGFDFTGGTGFRWGAAKVVATFGASTTWKLKGQQRLNVPTYRYLVNDASAERTFMMPDLRGSTPNTTFPNAPFAGETIWTERVMHSMLYDGKDVRRVGLEWGGSNILRSWFGMLQKGFAATVPQIDLYLCEFGANDAALSFNDGTGATLAWTATKRLLFKERLAKFIEHRNRYNRSAPVVFISPVILDDNPALTTSRTYHDSGADGEYNGVPMSRIEIARRLVEEVATTTTYGGGTTNNVYYINGLHSCGLEGNEEYVPFYINDSGTWEKQVGLRRATYHLDTNGPNGYVGEIEYDGSYGVGVDTFDMFFKWVANAGGTNEQIAGQRVHPSAMHDEAHARHIVDKIQDMPWYDTF
jgi:hypothetical protein